MAERIKIFVITWGDPMARFFNASRYVFLLVLSFALPAFSQIKVGTKAPDFGEGTVWLDSGHDTPHHISGYKGKVVLIDFWEYTCINCIRDFAVVKKWYAEYHPYGFEVIGVHYGEFNIGFQADNIRKAVDRFQLPWPIVADMKGTTWNAYASPGWPMRYLIDPEGKIVAEVFGEGDDDKMEAKIRELLAQSRPDVAKAPPVNFDASLGQDCGRTTQETYVGKMHGKTSIDDLGNHNIGDTADFLPHHSPAGGDVELMGKWKIADDGVTSAKDGASAETRFHARSAYAVMDSTGNKPLRVTIYLDGEPMTKDNAGSDVQFDSQGAYVTVSDGRMYYLLRGPALYEHLLSLEATAPGLTLHSFTYGNNCELQDHPEQTSAK